jgi:urease alpha subunit
MATIEGARACGLQEEIGSLEVGKRADIVLLTRDSYALAAANDPFIQLVYCETGASVDTVFVDGEIVVRDGRCTRVDERAVYRAVGEARASLQAAFAEAQHECARLELPVREMWQRLAAVRLPDMMPGVDYR